MATIHVYVPEDLKAEMDAAGELAPKWSNVAQEAFRLECQRIANRKKGGKMNAVVERLRASKEWLANGQKISGHAAGRSWAAEEARYDKLIQLVAWHEANDQSTSPYQALLDENEIHSAANEFSFWTARGAERVGSGISISKDFIDAFVKGAVEVYREVEDKL